MEPIKCVLSAEQEKHERKYFWAIFATLFVGVCMGVLGDYRGRQLNNNQVKALQNHEIIIRDYKKLITLHSSSIYVIEKFLAQEKELIRYHTEYVKDNQETHRMLSEILDILRKATKDSELRLKVRP